MEDDWATADQALEDFRAEVRVFVENDLRAAGHATTYRPTVYHYTDENGALGILGNGKLWFTERVHLNDPTEIQYGLDVGRESFEAAAKTRGPEIPRDAALHLRGEHHFGLSYYGFWTASFSLDGDDLGQWRSYANDGQGVCFGFSIDNFDMISLAALLPNAPNSLRFPINYDTDSLRASLQPYINRSLDILEAANLPARPSYHEHHGRALLYERDLFYA